MIITSGNDIHYCHVTKTLGLVMGNAIRGTHLGKDIAAKFRNLIGGEITGYTEMMSQAREQALDRMVAEASKLGANAVINTRFCTTSMMQGCAEFLAYGTAVEVDEGE